MSRKGRDAACTYCGVELTKYNRSSDHVLPKCLFSVSQRDGLVKVPACQRCNNHEKSVDDVYFRDWLVADSETDVSRVPRDVYRAFLRSAGDNPEGKVRSRVARAAMTAGRWEPRETASGLFAGYGFSYPFEWERVDRTGRRTAQGLYTDIYKQRLPQHATYEAGRVRRDKAEETWRVVAGMGARSRVMGGGECKALCVSVQEAAGVAIHAVLVFYDSIMVQVSAHAASLEQV